MIDLEMWRNMGMGLAALVGGIGLYVGHKKSNGEPPPNRPPPAQELLRSVERYREEILQAVDESDDRHRDRHLEIIRMLNQLSWELRSEKALQDIKNAYPPRSKE